MKKLTIIICILFVFATLAGCSSGHKRFHDKPLPDPEGFNAHFPDMDKNADDLVSYKEFEEYFPGADRNVFDAIDTGKDSAIDHDEWHAFKKAHGLKHKGQ